MYLTRMELDTSKRKTIIALTAPKLFHGAIEQALTERDRKLWRVDQIGMKTYLLLVTQKKPDLTAAAAQFGTADGWVTRDYSPFLENIHTGEKRRFRLTANPIITKSKGTGNRGDVKNHVTVEQQQQWLMDRAEKHGFHLQPDEFSVVESRWFSFVKGNEGLKKVVFHAVTFEGVLTVTDEALLRDALQNGIGREKAYGCGMMTVLRSEL